MADAGRNESIPILLGFVVIATVLWYSEWLVLNGEGTYVEGLEREPTIEIEYTIDASQEIVSVSLKNATPLLDYWHNREVISGPDSGSSEGSDEPTSSDSEDSSSSNLDATRTFVMLMLILTGLMLREAVRKQSWVWGRVTITSWLILGLMLMISVPMSAVSDFGLSEDGESSTGGFDSAGESEVSATQFAHFESESDVKFSLFSAPQFEYSSSGFDLGLLAEEDRQAVIDNVPEQGDSGYESLIGFEGELRGAPGKVAIWWLVLGILILYASNASRTAARDGSESARAGA